MKCTYRFQDGSALNYARTQRITQSQRQRFKGVLFEYINKRHGCMREAVHTAQQHESVMFKLERHFTITRTIGFLVLAL